MLLLSIEYQFSHIFKKGRIILNPCGCLSSLFYLLLNTFKFFFIMAKWMQNYSMRATFFKLWPNIYNIKSAIPNNFLTFYFLLEYSQLKKLCSFRYSAIHNHVSMHACVHAYSIASVVADSLRPYGLQSARLLCSWDSPDKNIGVCCHALLQGIF